MVVVGVTLAAAMCYFASALAQEPKLRLVGAGTPNIQAVANGSGTPAQRAGVRIEELKR
jgi:hypothetical protein